MLVKLVAQHKLLVEQFVTHRFALDDVVAAYETFGNAAHTQALKGAHEPMAPVARPRCQFARSLREITVGE